MATITVKEYSKRANLSIQHVYRMIKQNKLVTVKENDLTKIVVDEVNSINKRVAVKHKAYVDKNSNSERIIELKDEVKRLKKLVKKQEKRIEKLYSELLAEKDKTGSVMLSYINELQKLKQLPAPAATDIVTKDKKKKKK